MTAALTPWSLPLLVAMPLGLAMLALLNLLAPRRQVGLGLVTILACLALSAPAILEGEIVVIALGEWPPPLGIAWRLDLPAMLMLTMTATVASFASLALLADRETAEDNYLWPLWWLMWAGLNALLLSQDLFNLYVTLELVTLAGVGLVARSPQDPCGAAALRYLMASLLASLLYLLGIALLYGETGRLDIDLVDDLMQDGANGRLAAALLTLGLLIKSAMVPLHTWLPSAHARAQAPVSAMLSAVLVAVTLFVLWRLWLAPLAQLQTAQHQWLALTGVVALVWGGIQAALQARFKLLIAWSTLCQSGYAMLLLGLNATTSWPQRIGDESPAFQGAMQILLAHGLAKASLFIAAGAIMAAHDHDRLSRLVGDAERLPLAWLAIALASISLLGIPPTGGFVGKWWLLQGAAPHQPLIAAAVLAGTFFSAVCLWRLFDLALRPAERQATNRISRMTRVSRSAPYPHLAWLALGLALLAWGQGPLAGLVSPRIVSPSLALDTTGLAFLLPALAIWPVVLLATYTWRHTFPAALRLLALMLAAALLHVMTLLAADLLTFYTGAALLSLLGWAMVQHDGHDAARLAGVGYLLMLLLAEVAMLAGLALIATQTSDLRFASLTSAELPPLALGCMALGLAIKAGVLGVHAWLPVAHPVAPPMASALLSGLMIKLGLLGALRLLPLSDATADFGPLLVVLGLCAALYGALRGVMESDPKRVLAWSSVSQMGLLTVLLGLVLADRATPVALTALLLLAATHAMAKATLFLGAGMVNRLHGRSRTLAMLGMLPPAMALAGVPPTGGVLVKSIMEQAMQDAAWPTWPLTLAGIATALLMLRLFWLLHRAQSAQQTLQVPAWLWLAWATLGALPALLAWGWPGQAALAEDLGAALGAALVALLFALALAAMALLAGRHLPRITAEALRLSALGLARRLLRRGIWRFKRGEAWLMPWPAFGIALGVMALGMAASALLPG
ncbi:proton-conducting transporter membrane subunit [Billgrantia kenyensis]|uniref:NADH-quinone oxidoreductase subunit N n=1 Tax=Billgrantia kenyensis TaxID=321266 RepID=A0A7V9VY44_9GAMM|nr:proton-conducting transporter membrane subunit [Halomonas kenyensis]MBA2777569.1 NADH-quinone oxidoreductase subunit N [Halomonas kenyensis]MCG6660239.1 NADH-quinone oxidoreductase subunit N [Halomonas kenyensis]